MTNQMFHGVADQWDVFIDRLRQSICDNPDDVKNPSLEELIRDAKAARRKCELLSSRNPAEETPFSHLLEYAELIVDINRKHKNVLSDQ